MLERLESQTAPADGSPHDAGVNLAHDFGGAILFSFPLLMTMEMWWLGFYMDRFRLALFIATAFVLVLGLSYFEGKGESWRIDLLDALAAWAVGGIVSAVMLLLFAILKPGMSVDEIAGKISLHAVPGSIGAILARRLLEVDHSREEQKRRRGCGARVFFMAVGAIFLAFQLAPTEEMVLIGHQMTEWHAVALALVSLGVMHAFSASADEPSNPHLRGGRFWQTVSTATLPGYATALVVSGYVLWTFGRLDGMATAEGVMATLVLGFPAALGAAAARRIL
jgi:putative integral membrane protein (TIGR02587 family)